MNLNMNMYSPLLSAPAPPPYQEAVLTKEKKPITNSGPDSVSDSRIDSRIASRIASRIDHGEDHLVTACRNNDLNFLTTSEKLPKGIDYLYENKEKDCQLEKSTSLLHIACYENNPPVVKLLLEWGANPNIKLPKSGLTPIEIACADEQGHPEIVSLLARYLFPHRLDINASHCVKSPDYPADFTLLQLACRSQNVPAIKTLLANHADPNLTAQHWSIPPLHLVCGANSVDGDVINSLLEAKANINARYQESTALHVLCSSEQCNEQALHALLAGGADVNAVTSKGVTPLMLGSQNNTQMTDRLLMNDCIDVTMADYQGWQAIHYAAQLGHETAINALVDKGANANAKTNQGVTPLHLAMIGKYEPTIYALLDHGADISTKAPVTAYSRAKTCKITMYLFCSLLCCPFSVQGMCLSGACDEFWRDKRPLR